MTLLACQQFMLVLVSYVQLFVFVLCIIPCAVCTIYIVNKKFSVAYL